MRMLSSSARRLRLARTASALTSGLLSLPNGGTRSNSSDALYVLSLSMTTVTRASLPTLTFLKPNLPPLLAQTIKSPLPHVNDDLPFASLCFETIG